MSLINQYEKKLMSFNDIKKDNKIKKNKVYKNIGDNKRYKNSTLNLNFIQENNLICEQIENRNIIDDFYKLNYLSNIGDLIIDQYDFKPSLNFEEKQETSENNNLISINTNKEKNKIKRKISIKENCSDNILDYFDNPVEKKIKKI